MKRRILICSIIRNSFPHLPTWFNQILHLQSLCDNEWDMYLSVTENDSEDGTSEWLQKELPLLTSVSPFAGKGVVVCDKLGTQQFSSIWNIDRMKNLSSARQRCLNKADEKWGLDSFSKIAYIEPDVTYNPVWTKELILAHHPRAAGIGDPDIYSGWSLRSEKHPKESIFLYDTCATRQTDKDICWNFENGHKWRDLSLVQTRLGHFDSNCLHKIWSTFNCFCVYNARPFVNKEVKWGYVNRRINPSEIYIEDGDYGSGWLDADTSVMCEDFRARGHDKILLNTNCLIRHA